MRLVLSSWPGSRGFVSIVCADRRCIITGSIHMQSYSVNMGIHVNAKHECIRMAVQLCSCCLACTALT